MGEDELGHRSCSEYMSIDFGPDGAGDGRFHRTANDECILDGGARQFPGYDEHGLGLISEWKTHVCTQRSMQCGRDCMPKT